MPEAFQLELKELLNAPSGVLMDSSLVLLPNTALMRSVASFMST